jgi:hypothetical protein
MTDPTVEKLTLVPLSASSSHILHFRELHDHLRDPPRFAGLSADQDVCPDILRRHRPSFIKFSFTA